ELFPELAADLDARIDPAASAKQTVGVLQSFFRSLAAGAPEVPQVEAIVRDIATARGNVSVSELARRHGLSTRAMRREFLEVVGIPPKHYAKIVQMNAVVGALQADDPQTLSSLAMEHGYFDQSHFIRDFKRLVGSSPSAFLRSRSAFLRTFLGQASH
ncbi:MAG: helix-turn-helix domain-containing protein, partial [bacterium]